MIMLYVYMYVYVYVAPCWPLLACWPEREHVAPGPDRLGLKCHLAWGETRVVGGGGKGGNFMYLNHNFSLVT